MPILVLLSQNAQSDEKVILSRCTTRRNCNKTNISRITYQTTTLFAQCMRYLNLHIVCKH